MSLADVDHVVFRTHRSTIHQFLMRSDPVRDVLTLAFQFLDLFFEVAGKYWVRTSYIATLVTSRHNLTIRAYSTAPAVPSSAYYKERVSPWPSLSAGYMALMSTSLSTAVA